MFKLGQHARDEQLMGSLIKYLDCGSLYKNKEAFEYRVAKFSDIENKVIPGARRFPLLLIPISPHHPILVGRIGCGGGKSFQRNEEGGGNPQSGAPDV